MSNLSGSSGPGVCACPLALDGCCPSYQVSWRPLAAQNFVFAGEMPVAPAYASRPIHLASLWCIWLSGFPAVALELPASHSRGKGIQWSRERKNIEIQGKPASVMKRHRYAGREANRLTVHRDNIETLTPTHRMLKNLP